MSGTQNIKDLSQPLFSNLIADLEAQHMSKKQNTKDLAQPLFSNLIAYLDDSVDDTTATTVFEFIYKTLKCSINNVGICPEENVVTICENAISGYIACSAKVLLSNQEEINTLLSGLPILESEPSI